MHRGRTMGKHKLAFVAFDSAKEKHAVAIADDGRDGEVRYLGEIDNSPDAVRKLVAKLSRQYERLHFCYEAGPTGYGLHRQLTDLGHVCARYRRLIANCQKGPGATTGIARELAAFLWAIGHQVAPLKPAT